MAVHWGMSWVWHLGLEGMQRGSGVAPLNVKRISRVLVDVDTVASNLFSGGAARAGVRVSNVLEVGDVQYLDKNHDAGLPSTSLYHSSSVKGKNRRISASPILKKKKFSVANLAPAHTSFEAAVEKTFAESRARRRGRDPQFSSRVFEKN